MIEARKNMCAFSNIKQNNLRQKTKFTDVPNCQTSGARKNGKKLGGSISTCGLQRKRTLTKNTKKNSPINHLKGYPSKSTQSCIALSDICFKIPGEGIGANEFQEKHF